MIPGHFVRRWTKKSERRHCARSPSPSHSLLFAVAFSIILRCICIYGTNYPSNLRHSPFVLTKNNIILTSNYTFVQLWELSTVFTFPLHDFPTQFQVNRLQPVEINSKFDPNQPLVNFHCCKTSTKISLWDNRKSQQVIN